MATFVCAKLCLVSYVQARASLVSWQETLVKWERLGLALDLPPTHWAALPLVSSIF